LLRQREKGAGAKPALPCIKPAAPDYPFVTTGGGGAAQPAIVARASTATIARASFFIDVPPILKRGSHSQGWAIALVLKRHTRQEFIILRFVLRYA
jgi:hypothetical protein